MVGYPFVLPDIIGGNGLYESPPSKVMYIRWVQAIVFMVVVQFLYTPWDFYQRVNTSMFNKFKKQLINKLKNVYNSCFLDGKYIQIMNIRGNHVDTIIELMRDSISKDSLLNPPV